MILRRLAMPISHRFIETNGIRMHIAEQGSGPTVLLCHGFPECWYSWRHQLGALASAGFHVDNWFKPHGLRETRDRFSSSATGLASRDSVRYQAKAAGRQNRP